MIDSFNIFNSEKILGYHSFNNAKRIGLAKIKGQFGYLKLTWRLYVENIIVMQCSDVHVQEIMLFLKVIFEFIIDIVDHPI